MLKQHVLVELKNFIQAVANVRSNQKTLISNSLIRTSLHLLEDLPAAREIVFEYFALVAEVSVQAYLSNNHSEEECFTPIQEALENLVCKGPNEWCPVIATWSLDLVANLSDNYTKRKMSIVNACNYWLNCAAMKGLLTMVSICFRKFSNAEAEKCVETMIINFQRKSYFDWVVARLGGCFPLKIISQILQCSLKRFADNYRNHFDSEIDILDYLSFAHEPELKQAMKDMLRDGFEPKKPLDASIVPFLLVMVNNSDSLLQNLISVFLEIYNVSLQSTIAQRAPIWMSNKLFADMQPSLNKIVLRLKSHGAELLISVSKLAESYMWCQDFLEYSLQELEQVILNARVCPLMDDLATGETKNLLWKSCLSTNLLEQQTAVRLLLIISTQHSQIYYQTISELLRKSYDLNPNGLGAVIRIMCGHAGVVEFPDILPGLKMVLEDVLLQEQFQRARLALAGLSDDSEAWNTFKNLNTLTKMQKENIFPYMKQHLLLNSLDECLPKILHIFEVTLTKLLLRIDSDAAAKAAQKLKKSQNNNSMPSMAFKKLKSELQDNSMKMDECSADNKNDSDADEEENLDKFEKRLRLAHAIMDLLNTIEAGAKASVMRTTEILKLAVLTVKYFFVSLNEKSESVRTKAINRALHLLRRQCSSRKTARTACLRELIEGALFYYGFLFGQYDEPRIDVLAIPEQEMVLVQNQRHSLGPNANRTVLHAGVIGRGLRPEIVMSGEECNAELQSLLLKALEACCTDEDKQNMVEGYSMISLLLVEMVSTDVMYNGLPFPDEEFSKVTMERDLLIRRAFITSPILWALLGFIATHRPALCFSSVLLRALCATCLHQWRAKNVNKFQPINVKEELMQTTKKLLKILAMGQLLPHPLSHLHMIIEYFEAPEIALLLKECVWNYLKDHVPSPALFHIDGNGLHWRNESLVAMPPQYVDTLRNLMQKKLTKLGPFYHQMFIMSEIDDPAKNPTAGSSAETKI